jgi:hypothetical protein
VIRSPPGLVKTDRDATCVTPRRLREESPNVRRRGMRPTNPSR